MAFKAYKSEFGTPLREIDPILQSGATHKVLTAPGFASNARRNVGTYNNFGLGTPGKMTTPKSRPSFNGSAAKSEAPPMPRSKAVYATPKSAELVRSSTKSLPLASSSPPMPRDKSGSMQKLGARLDKAWRANRGKNEAKALAGMKKSRGG